VWANIYDELAFSMKAVNTHPLNVVWKNALSGLGEADHEDALKWRVIEAVKKSFHVDINNWDFDERRAAHSILKNFTQYLEHHISFLYDPTLKYQTEQESREGGFVLHYLPSEKERYAVNKATLFRKLMTKAMQSAIQKSNQVILSPRRSKRSIQEKLLKEVERESFIDQILYYYQGSSPISCEGRAAYHEYKHTPWVDYTGRDAKKVLEIYLEQFHLVTHQACPDSGEELLQFIVNYLVALPEKERALYLKSTQFLIPMRMKNVHSFCLVPGSSPLRALWQNGLQWEAAVDDLKKILKKDLDKQASLGFKNKLKEQFADISLMDVDETSISALMCSYIEAGVPQELLETLFIPELSDEAQSAYQQLIIPFADTNWSKKGDRIFYALKYNVILSRFDLCEVTEHNKLIRHLPENDWRGISWEIFST
jgi:hypothetical protein